MGDLLIFVRTPLRASLRAVRASRVTARPVPRASRATRACNEPFVFGFLASALSLSLSSVV